jgi:hypothetical protein
MPHLEERIRFPTASGVAEDPQRRASASGLCYSLSAGLARDLHQEVAERVVGLYTKRTAAGEMRPGADVPSRIPE